MTTNYRLETTFACALLVVDEGDFIVEAAPIFRSWVGCALASVVQHYQMKGMYRSLEKL